MFTGLVEAKGTLARRAAHGPDARLVIEAPARLVAGSPFVLGESIAIDGVCLTVAAIEGKSATVFEADASAETLARTTLGSLAAGATINLERALTLGARLGGHIVSGHVDGTGRVAEQSPIGAAMKVVFEAPRDLMRFIAPKGSICVSGVSLTVNGVNGNHFDVFLVPHTQENTSFGTLKVGAAVNLEVDVLARYVARLMEANREGSAASGTSASDAAWLDRLTRAGYM
jgi:riboflavin synthase